MNWWNQAACLNSDPELFFPGERINQNWASRAKKICDGCPVQRQCLTAAMREEAGNPADYRHGVWGGLNGTERYQLAKRGLEVA